MLRITATALPPQGLLAAYRDRGAFTDCYVTTLDRPLTLAAYVDAFYTTPLFKLERLILAAFAKRPSTDLQARQLAIGEVDSFAAWRVEAREPDQILLADMTGRTRSWLMVVPARDGDSGGTRLYFGSAVVPVAHPATGQRRMGFVFSALLGFHKLYSRALLSSARRKLTR
jgi:hypothetical protein